MKRSQQKAMFAKMNAHKERTFIRIDKRQAQKFAQKEFRVPIIVEEARRNQFTGQEVVLLSTKTIPKRYHVTYLGQDANADFGTNEKEARKSFEDYKE